MDWENEPYVKVYTRETDDDLILSWEALALWRAMLVKFDRSGLIETRRGARGLAAVVRMPAAVVERVLPELLTDGRVQEGPEGYLAPNFLAAQEARKSDKLRQRESREKRRQRSIAGTPRRSSSRNVTDPPPVVTKRDQTSRGSEGPDETVTLCSADPDPLRCEARSPARAHDPTQPTLPRTEPPGDQGPYDPENPDHRRRLREKTYLALDEAMRRVAAELGQPAPIPLPPLSAITPGTQNRAWRELGLRIREEGAVAPMACAHVLAVLERDALRTGDTQWLSDKAFAEGTWGTARRGRTGGERESSSSAPIREMPSLAASGSDDEPDFTMGHLEALP